MTLEPIGMVLLLVIAASFFCRLEIVAIIMGCTTMFVASSAISIGAFTINPALVFLPVFAFRAFVAGGAPRDAPITSQQIPIVCFFLYAIVITLVCPIVFANEIMVIWPSREVLNSLPRRLAPGGGNFTQAGYVLAGVICFLSSQAIFLKIKKTNAIANVIIWIACLNISLSMLDLVSFYSGNSGIMDIIRNGNYAILNGDTVEGIKRTIGSFTEASIYSIYNLGVFSFLLALYRGNVRPRVSGILAMLTIIFLLLSLSTTAFVGIALYISRFAVASFYRTFIRGRLSWRASIGLTVLCAIVAGGMLYYIINDGITLIDELILKKATSASGQQRATLNLYAWDAFVGSFGLGVGVGSTRASSFLLVLLSNVGLFGAILYVGFIYKSVRLPTGGDTPLEARVCIAACREGVIGFFIAACLSYAVLDIGLLIYVLTGAASAIGLKVAHPSPARHSIRLRHSRSSGSNLATRP